jgi:hypothetical protein
LVKDAKIPFGPIIPLPNRETLCLKEYLGKALSLGHIVLSKFPAGSPIFFVKNKDNMLRPVIDCRHLNEITVKNRYALPLISS